MDNGWPDFLRGFPNGFALRQISARAEQIVDLVRRDRLPLEFELKAVHQRSLLCLRFDAPAGEKRIGHRTFRGVEQHLIQFAHAQRIELGAMFQQGARFADDGRIAVESGVSFARDFGRRVVFRRDVGHRFPLRFAIHFVERRDSWSSRAREIDRRASGAPTCSPAAAAAGDGDDAPRMWATAESLGKKR